MAITKSKKEEQLAALTAKFKEASGVAFAKFDQLGVEEAQIIRRELRANGMSYTVIKKTLMAIAAKDAGLAEFDSDNLEGSVAVIVSQDDAVMPAQFIKKFKKDFFDKATKHAKVDFAGCLFEGNFLDAAATTEFANTATREESLAKIVGMLKSGPQKLHNVFNSGLQRTFNVLKNADKFAA
jgi:ribosomal protein L10